MKEKKEKKKKEKFVDDGRVVASMDCETVNGYRSKKHHDNHRAIREARLSRKERWAIYKAALDATLPVLGMFLCGIILAIALLSFFWIN